MRNFIGKLFEFSKKNNSRNDIGHSCILKTKLLFQLSGLKML
jgi:hypothetical protein